MFTSLLALSDAVLKSGVDETTAQMLNVAKIKAIDYGAGDTPPITGEKYELGAKLELVLDTILERADINDEFRKLLRNLAIYLPY